MFKKLISKFFDYVAYIILGMLGLVIFNALYITWFTDTGRVALSFVMVSLGILWAIIRLFTKIG